MDRDESEKLLQEMFDIVEDPAIIYEHHWRVGDLVMWDNLACLHARTDWPQEQTPHAAPLHRRRRAAVLARVPVKCRQSLRRHSGRAIVLLRPKHARVQFLPSPLAERAKIRRSKNRREPESMIPGGGYGFRAPHRSGEGNRRCEPAAAE